MAERREIESLMCSLCLDVFEDATLLKCGHSFCRRCLDSYDQCQPHVKDSIPCPLCREETDLDPARVAGLSSNVSINSLVDEFNTTDNPVAKLYEDPKCSECHSSTRTEGTDEGDKNISAVAFCYQCEIFMCEQCKTAHERLKTLFAEHIVMSVNDAMNIKGQRAEQRDRCPEHKSEVREFYCADCRAIICHKCTIVKHNVRDHEIRERVDFEREIRGKIDDINNQCEVERRVLEKCIKDVEQKRRDVGAILEEVNHDIDGEFADIQKRLEGRKMELKKKIEDFQEQSNDKLDKMKDTARKMSAKLSSSADLLAQGRRGGLEGDLLASHEYLRQELKELLQTCRDWSKEYSPVPEALKDTASSVRFTTSDINTTIGELVISESWKLAQQVDLLDIGNDPMMGLSRMSADEVLMCCTQGGADIITCDGEKRQFCDIDVNCGDVTVLTNGRVALIDRGRISSDHELRLTDARGNVMHVREKFDIVKSNTHKSLDSDSFNNIYVSYVKEKLIHVFKPEGGHPVKTIKTNSSPYQVHTTKCGRLVVRSMYGVEILSETGQVLSSMGTGGTEFTNIYPAVDDMDTLYAAWINTNMLTIKSYTLDGVYVGTIVDHIKIKKPKRSWYYMKCLSPDTIVFCTTGVMYVFKRQITNLEEID